MKRKSRSLLFINPLCPLILVLIGSAQPADKWQELRRRYLSLKSLSGAFTQTVQPTNDTGQEPTVFRGRFIFQFPYRFRLEVNEPVRQIIIGNDSVVWFYFPDEQRAVLQTRRQPVPLLSFIAPLLDSTATIIEEGAGVITFATGPEALLTDLRLELNKTGTQVNAFSFTDELGNRCRFQLANQRWNPPIPAKTFRFVPPAGVTVEYQ
ncbi:MAG: LolA family protein [candidate division WOR-3 bacterium]